MMMANAIRNQVPSQPRIAPRSSPSTATPASCPAGDHEVMLHVGRHAKPLSALWPRASVRPKDEGRRFAPLATSRAAGQTMSYLRLRASRARLPSDRGIPGSATELVGSVPPHRTRERRHGGTLPLLADGNPAESPTPTRSEITVCLEPWGNLGGPPADALVEPGGVTELLHHQRTPLAGTGWHRTRAP